MAHAVLRNARSVQYREAPDVPLSAVYDAALGVWMMGRALLARDGNFKLQTKKKDVETGEDQKGQ